MTSDPVQVVSVYGPANAGVRARALEPLSRLEQTASLVTYFGAATAGARDFARSPARALLSEASLRRLARSRPGTLLLSREASPLSKGHVEVALLRAAERGVYDIDDALHHDSRGRLFDRFFSKPAKATAAAGAATTVIAGNEYLATWASELAADVRVIPTCVAPERYQRKVDYTLADPPRMVWIGTPSGERYLRDIAPAIIHLRETRGVRLSIIGATTPGLGHLEEYAERLPWSLDLVHERLGTFDLGIMPLADTPYERGKCAYKLLEYGAAGLPVVASPVGLSGDILRQVGAPGPEHPGDWSEALEMLLGRTTAERERLGTALRLLVERNYSFQRWLPEWSSAVLT